MFLQYLQALVALTVKAYRLLHFDTVNLVRILRHLAMAVAIRLSARDARHSLPQVAARCSAVVEPPESVVRAVAGHAEPNINV